MHLLFADTIPQDCNGSARKRVVTLHASAGSSKQWRDLAAALHSEWAVQFHDHINHGRGAAWGQSRAPALADHVQALRPLLSSSSPCHLVAHSFGAVIALQAALDHPSAVRSLALYEPVLIALLERQTASPEPEQQVFRVADDVRQRVACGDTMGAARGFVNYWGGMEAWERLDECARAATASRMPSVANHFDIIESAFALVNRVASLQIPVLLMTGDHSTAAAQAVTQRLSHLLPHARCQVVLGAGHMGPVTHAQAVARRIVDFLYTMQ